MRRPRQETIWGKGKSMREFLNVGDMAGACAQVMNLAQAEYAKYTEPRAGHINVGSGTDVSIGELAQSVALVVGAEGEVVFDSTKPDGMPRKLMDSGRLRAAGWQPEVKFERGQALTYTNLLANSPRR